MRTRSSSPSGRDDTNPKKSPAKPLILSPPLRRELPEEGHGVDHGGRLVSRRGQPLPKLVPEGDHVVREVEAVVLEDRRDARDAVQSAAVLDGDYLAYTVS